MDRAEISRALGKALAYKSAGKDEEADQWALELLRLLAAADIVPAGHRES